MGTLKLNYANVMRGCGETDQKPATPMASGGESDIYRFIDPWPAFIDANLSVKDKDYLYDVVVSGVPILFKRYKDSEFRGYESAMGRHIERLIERYQSMGRSDQNALRPYCAWPLASVYDGWRFRGFLLPDVNHTANGGPASDVTWQGRRYHTTGNLAAWLQNKEEMEEDSTLRFPLTGAGRASMIAAILSYCHTVHDVLEMVIGDISGKNILAYVPAPDDQARYQCQPHFIEIDTYRFSDSVPAMPQRDTYGWFPPEHDPQEDADASDSFFAEDNEDEPSDSAEPMDSLRQARMSLQTQQTDVYKIALLIARMADRERGAARNFYTSPHEQERILRLLTEDYSARFGRLVVLALHRDPGRRPDMKDLYTEFKHCY